MTLSTPPSGNRLYLGEWISAGKPSGKKLWFPGETHLITVGPPGTGKSMGVLVPNLLSMPHSAVVIDPKAELYSTTALHRGRLGPVIVLNPFGVLGIPSTGYNPLLALNLEHRSFPDDAARIAEALVVMEPGKGEHFSTGARQLLTALIMWVRGEYGSSANLGHVRRLLGQSKSDFDKMIKRMLRCGYEPLTGMVGRFIGDTDEIADVKATLSGQITTLDSIDIVDDLNGPDIDWTRLKRECVTVYIVIAPQMFETHSAWIRLIIGQALHSLMEAPQNARPPVVVMLDEFYATVGRLPIVQKMMGLTRGYGVQLWPCFQSLLQAQELFGHSWETFVACAGALQAFAPGDLFTADYLSKRAGQDTIVVPGLGPNNHGSYSSRPAFLPQDIMRMPRGQTIILSNQIPAYALARAPHYTQTEWAYRAGSMTRERA